MAALVVSMTLRVGEFLVTSEGNFSMRCEGMFQEYDVIRWRGRLGSYKSVKCFTLLEVSKESIAERYELYNV